MIHPRKYEEYELGVLVIHAKHDQKLGLWVEVSVAPAKKDKGCGLEEGLGWWCIPERVKSMGSGCGLEVHLEIWGFFFLEGHAGSRVHCAGLDSGLEGRFWIQLCWLQVPILSLTS